ncbi:MAG TPA: GLUG motif-containing protein, partial [Candidatus Hydrogenedentes bacterium]|nr:GLUG motif-containing protein [Candidatus Hydrogenedentota bacterium]
RIRFMVPGLVMVCLALLPGLAHAQIAIATLDDLNKIGRDPAYPLDDSYVLTADIDASATQGWNGGAGFEPIGAESTPFTGTFDGQGHVIQNLYINRPDADYVGLFGYTDSGAQIRNLGMKDCSVTGNRIVAIMIGLNNGSITSCHARGTVTANSVSYVCAGVLVGENAGTLSSCYATGAVTVTAGFVCGGGLVGMTRSGSTITTCFASVAISAAPASSYSPVYVGGLVGSNSGSIASCYTTGTTYSSSYYAGGLVGDNAGTLSYSYATGSVTGNTTGGLVGINRGGATIQFCYWDTQTTGESSGVGYGTAGGTGLATAQMKQQASFMGWDFTSVWTIQEDQTYPYFLWQATLG